MPLYTQDEIRAEVTALKVKIAKAEDQQSYTSGGPGGGMQQARGDLKAMYDRLRFLETEYERLEGLESGGAANLVEFTVPQ